MGLLDGFATRARGLLDDSPSFDARIWQGNRSPLDDPDLITRMWHRMPDQGGGNVVPRPTPQSVMGDMMRQLNGEIPTGVGVNVVRGFTEGPAIIGFHGSPVRGLSELRPSERGPMGAATYLSPAPSVAGQYARGGSVYRAEIPDADVFHGAGRSWMPPGTNAFTLSDQQISRLAQAAPAELRDPIRQIGEATMKYGDGGYQFFGRLSQLMRSEEAAQQLFQKAGFRAVSGLVDGPEIAVFGPVKPTGLLGE